MWTGTALRIIRASHGLEPSPDLESLETYINQEMPGEYFAMLNPVNCGPNRGDEMTVCDASGEIVHRYYSCSPGAHSLSTVKWIAGRLEEMEKNRDNDAGKEKAPKENRDDPLHAHVEHRIRRAAAGAEPPGLRTMADFIDDHLENCHTQLVKGQCGMGSVYLNVFKGDEVVFEFSTCLPGADRRKLAKWICGELDAP